MRDLEPTKAVDVSVVVASFSGPEAAARCLASLEAHAPGVEIIVATNTPSQALAARFPAVCFLPCPASATVFQLRSVGLALARGRLIALIEDHCTITPGWLAALKAADASGRTVLGGPIANGRTTTSYDWALFLCEYSAFMPPLPEGPTPALLAANTAYALEALLACRASWQGAFYENEVHAALRALGHEPYLAPQFRVDSYLCMIPREARAHLFAGGRRFGGYRKSRSSPTQRLLWTLAAPAVPLLMLARIAGRVAARRPVSPWTFLRGLPQLICLVLAWAAGEFWGYVGPIPQDLTGHKVMAAGMAPAEGG
jgi:hypothetical protein